MSDFVKIEGKNIGDIKVFALSTCGWCRRTLNLLKSHNIEFSFIDMDLIDKSIYNKFREQHLQLNPNGSFPTIVIGKNIIIGFDEEKINLLIEEDCGK